MVAGTPDVNVPLNLLLPVMHTMLLPPKVILPDSVAPFEIDRDWLANNTTGKAVEVVIFTSAEAGQLICAFK